MLGVLAVFSLVNLDGAQASSSQRVFVTPLSFDTTRNEWNVLLVEKDGHWQIPFDEKDRQSVMESVDRILRYFTAGLYTERDKISIVLKATPSGDKAVFFFVNKFVRGSDLYRKARSRTKGINNFKWVRVQDVLGKSTGLSLHRGVEGLLRGLVQDALVDYQTRPSAGRPAVGTMAPSSATAAAGTASGGGAAAVFPTASGSIATTIGTDPRTTHRRVVRSGIWSPDTLQSQGQVGLYFYQSGQSFYEFTNFWVCNPPIFIDGQSWLTAEHYFQAQKFAPGSAAYNAVCRAKSAREVFDLANGRTGAYRSQIRPDWKSVSIDVMRKAVYEKFSQNANLKSLLLATGTATLVENAGKNDPFWGAGADMNGQNWLGKILMEVRDVLRAERRR